MELTPEQLETLRHMLGINTPRDKEPKPYRDYYCAAKGDKKLAELARLGAVERVDTVLWSGDYYITTPAGRAAAMASHRSIRYSRDTRRYCKFLSIKDALPGLTFRDFLTRSEFADARKAA